MEVRETPVSGVYVVKTKPFSDYRGSLSRLFCKIDLDKVLESRRIVQINHSLTRQAGAVRGMHYQLSPHAEMKMVRCIKGRVWDVAVDLREGSQTFLHSFAQELTSKNGLMLIIPEGCAHGFQVQDADSELLYLHTAAYTPETEGGVRFDDPTLDISWPLPVTDISTRDQQYDFINKDFKGLKV